MKRLKCSLKNVTIIIKGGIILHNFLFDYRDGHSDPIPDDTERSIFNEDMVDSGESTMVVGDDVGIRGNISNHERETRLKDLKLRDKLRLSLMDHDLRRPRKEEWFEDN